MEPTQKLATSCEASSAPGCSVSYKFRTIQEAVDRVPSDKIRECFDEMGKTFAVAKSMAEAVYHTAVELARKDGKEFPAMPSRIIELPEEMEWIDDGKGECVADIQNLCEIRITKATGAEAPTQNPESTGRTPRNAP